MATAQTKEKETSTKTASGQLYLVSALVQKDEALNELADFIKAAGAEVKKTENLGVKNLFVKINKHTSLTLVSVYFTAEEGDVAKKLQESLKHEEYIERFLLTTWRGPLDAPTRAKRAPKDKEEATEKETA